MSLLCNTAGQQLRSGTQYTGSYNAFTACGWARHRSYVGNDTVIRVGGDGSNPAVQMYFRATPFSITDGPTNYDFARRPADNAWFFWALTHDSANQLAYWCYPHENTFDSTSFADTVTANVNGIFLGGGPYGGPDCLYGDMAQFRGWNRKMSTRELLREKNSPRRPADWNSLVWWSPFDCDLLDYAKGRVWTKYGTPGWGAAFNTAVRSVAVLPSWALSGAVTPDNYGTPYDHSGTKPYSSLWRPARA